MIRLLLLPACLLLACVQLSCTRLDPVISETLRLRHQGADMPIWVRGNFESRKLLLFLHGGPGECSICLREYFAGIEAEMAVAYWDQRISGSASGTAGPETIRYTQYAEDLELVIRLLQRQYPGAQIYLFGHSFGVELAWQFLTTGQQQDLVRGAILLNGTYATYDWLKAVEAWMLREADRQGDTEALNYVQSHPVRRETMRQTDWGAWYSRMFRLGANPVWPTDDPGFRFRRWFRSPGSPTSQWANTSRYDRYYAEEIFTFDRSEQLGQIRIPIGLFWGLRDGIMPAALAQETLRRLPGPVDYVEFPDSWHSAFHTETEAFTRAVLAFAERH